MNSDKADEQATRFYEGAERRLMIVMPIVGVAAAVVLTGVYGWRVGAGVVLGCAVAYANFHWLRRIVAGLADRATQQGHSPSGGIVFKFVIRYALLAIAAYAILSVSPASLYGFLGGLFLPVAGILVEAVYEIYMSQRRGL